ncbi:sulfotransferase domain-containing protein [Wenzhouxiangella sp. AB-CW3]|uniref:sulfotransferase domain-containing protein n=1 Tax=Wenzhouxiangella sp. AB-CW3 TaxID=2771012 RepID=UPI00168B8FA5|nr:sulfotransferase domain-containing protein [Wenzhouxiangella sp. AB-CW3]QOC23802.1 sulfotransferase domain-containing protein [Wenzhouxiangella sp. AB-CW3]
MSSGVLTLHLGLPKTGTTWLQEKVLPSAVGLNVIYKKFQPEFSYAIHRFLIHGEWRDRIDVSQLAELVNAERTIFTDENVSIPMQGIWTGKGCRPDRVAHNAQLLATELGGCEIRLMMTLRRQDTWLASRYAESAKHFEEPGQEDFERLVSRVLERNSRSKSWLYFDQVFWAFSGFLNEEQMIFLTQEELAEDPDSCMERLAAFLDVSFSEKPGLKKKRVNRLHVRPNVWKMKNWDDLKVQLREEVSADVLAHFAESNRRFTGLTGVDLSELEYY